jgi:hypothetical protein
MKLGWYLVVILMPKSGRCKHFSEYSKVPTVYDEDDPFKKRALSATHCVIAQCGEKFQHDTISEWRTELSDLFLNPQFIKQPIHIQTQIALALNLLDSKEEFGLNRWLSDSRFSLRKPEPHGSMTFLHGQCTFSINGSKVEKYFPVLFYAHKLGFSPHGKADVIDVSPISEFKESDHFFDDCMSSLSCIDLFKTIRFMGVCDDENPVLPGLKSLVSVLNYRCSGVASPRENGIKRTPPPPVAHQGCVFNLYHQFKYSDMPSFIKLIITHYVRPRTFFSADRICLQNFMKGLSVEEFEHFKDMICISHFFHNKRSLLTHSQSGLSSGIIFLLTKQRLPATDSCLMRCPF